MKTIYGLVVLLLFVVLFTFSESKASDSRKKAMDNLTFDNTMQWGSDFLDLEDDELHYLHDWQSEIHLSDPPANSSAETTEELKLLRSYKLLRTNEKVTEIISQIELRSTVFGGHMASEYFDVKKYPLTAQALEIAFHDIGILTMKEKRKFNRVRPSFLDPTLEPTIPVPEHPAYPSGHSTQSHFLALFLSRLEPEKSEELQKEADSIALNREIIGLHYPSDSKAGKELAAEFMEILLKNDEFNSLLEKAKKEW